MGVEISSLPLDYMWERVWHGEGRTEDRTLASPAPVVLAGGGGASKADRRYSQGTRRAYPIAGHTPATCLVPTPGVCVQCMWPVAWLLSLKLTVPVALGQVAAPCSPPSINRDAQNSLPRARPLSSALSAAPATFLTRVADRVAPIQTPSGFPGSSLKPQLPSPPGSPHSSVALVPFSGLVIHSPVPGSLHFLPLSFCPGYSFCLELLPSYSHFCLSVACPSFIPRRVSKAPGGLLSSLGESGPLICSRPVFASVLAGATVLSAPAPRRVFCLSFPRLFPKQSLNISVWPPALDALGWGLFNLCIPLRRELCAQ